MSTQRVDVGTAYGMKPIAADARLTQVGPGTPMGELMRRYWQPFFTSAELTSDKPRRVRLLGENLVAFRDKEGRPGLLFEHCLHRGASLYFGRIEEEGIRCCNHGWKFDCEGQCIDQPFEPRGRCSRYRQPWYPVQERYGLVYTYMGPPEKKPVLPRWRHLEDLGPDEYIETRYRPGYGPLNTEYDMLPIDINFLPAIEQTLDGAHVPWLHYHHSGDQFTSVKLIDKKDGDPPPYARIRDTGATMICESTQNGVTQGSPLALPDGTILVSCNETVVPNIGIVPNFFEMLYVVPVDDDHYVSFLLFRNNKGSLRGELDELHDGKLWWEMTGDEHQAMPGDYEAQSSIPAPASSFEHFATSDRAISLWRHRLGEALDAVEEGRDPIGVSFDENEAPRETGAIWMRPIRPGEFDKQVAKLSTQVDRAGEYAQPRT